MVLSWPNLVGYTLSLRDGEIDSAAECQSPVVNL